MVPTIDAIKQAFDFFNKQYFNGNLPPVKFSYNCPKNELAHYTPGSMKIKMGKVDYWGLPAGTLSVTRLYSRDEKDVLTSILHEMVHMYVLYVLRKYPLRPHGADFMAKANELRQFGWNITKTTDLKDTDSFARDVKASSFSENYMSNIQNNDDLYSMYQTIMQLNAYMDQLEGKK